ncbi:MAG: Dihydropteroate synthase [Steroidobacteraceae bacterium]|nr:Dihydropteroate synthase [Steroidobacteraceae bacterium]
MKLVCGSRTLDLATPQVMGVVNVTPDSFSDGGAYFDPDAALARVERVVAEGAAIVDIGGESTRPGAAPVSASEELHRVIPAIERAVRLPVVVSVDTSRPEVMRAAIAAGAHMVNDVRALAAPGALAAVAGTRAAVCLMHMRGSPADMQDDPRYGDVVAEVAAFLAARVAACERAGIARERIAIDPGFGFGKTLEHNLELLRRLGTLGEAGLPVVVGLSRKRMIGAITGRPVGERLAGSVAAAVIAVLRGACIVRAHDVAEAVDGLRIVAAVMQGENG